ncbi:hypothetical protein PTKIN_Ptkin06aG0158400 [Pterospermum kingtungense]
MEAVISIVGSILGSLAGKAVEYTVDPIARQFSYLFKPKTKFQNLRGQLQQLKDARERVQQNVNQAIRQGEDIYDNVNRWLTEVNGKISEEAAAQFKHDEEKAKQRCFVGFCPNFKSRYQLSCKAEKEANTIAQLLEEKGRFNGVSHPSEPEGTATRLPKEYEAFESRTGVFDAVMKALKDANLSIIGVYGMGGVGKTTLVKQVARQAKKENLFDEVVMAAVTQSFNLKKIQDQIADDLGLKFEKQSDSGRAGELCNRLKKTSKVLVILDDIWVKLDMEALGIPYGAEHQGCKILLTSRELNVLSSLMGSQENVPIETLKEEEAWDLFQKMATGIVLRHDLQPTAKEVAKKCAGLPIAIVTIGKAMKNKKTLFEWKDALLQLSRPSQRNFKGIPGDVYLAIELSYKFLDEEEYQPTFLLCSIMSHDAAVEDLLKYGFGLGLFHGVNTIQETRYRVSTLVSNLKASSMLLDGSTPERFDMHDVVRDVAISIATRDRHWLALGRDDVFNGWSDEEKRRNCKLISLQHAEVSEFFADLGQLECPNLTFLSFSSEDSSLKFPDNFFEGLQKLRVLDFSQMHFSSLPPSLSTLNDVHTLCLSGCFLEDIAIIGELKNLEILNLQGSDVAVLPGEIGHLTKLKVLDLSGCYCLEVIPPNVLSSLSRLQELYLYRSFDGWEVDKKAMGGDARLVELQHLSHLTTLEVHIPKQQAMPKEFFSGKLERFKISIGEKWGWSEDNLETSRNLKLKLNKSIHNLYDIGIKTLLRKAENLYLNGVADAMDMLYDPDIEGFSHLKHLYVRNDSEVKYIINSVKLVSCKVVFPVLESLMLYDLMKLEAICDGQVLKAGYFGRLKIIKVEDCKKLKNLFSFAIARELSQVLEEIEVYKCESCTELIVEKREEDDDNIVVEFRQLRSLKLFHLPNFKGVFYSEKRHSSSQQDARRVESTTATSLFDPKPKVVFPKLKKLHLYSIDIEKLWDDHQLHVTSSSVQNLTSLTVTYCDNLKNLFTSSMVTSFVQLERLVVEDCYKMEEVIIVNEGEEERMRKIVFPKLQELKLDNLQNMKRFCFGNYPIEFPFLRKLWIERCPVFNTFHSDSTTTIVGNEAVTVESLLPHVPKYLFTDKVSLPMLEYLRIYALGNLERLWPNKLVDDSFSKLTHFELKYCKLLKNVFPLSMLTTLQRLNQLSIWSCDSLEEIFESQEEGSSSNSTTHHLVHENIAFGFPQLGYLELQWLPKLKSFFPKMHATYWPSLKEMTVRECDKVEIFAAEPANTNGKDPQEEIPIQRPLFWIEQLSFPILQELRLGWNEGMKEIFHAHHQLPISHYFSKLKLLRLEWYAEQVAIFPSYLFPLLSLPNLQRLEISFCRFKELVFQSEGVGCEENPASATASASASPWMLLSQLTELRLRGLWALTHLWKEKEAFQNLRILSVGSCPKLKYNLVPSTVCFPNLVTLEVLECDGIIKLVTHSTAKSLVQLREMRIISCRNIEEIIQGSDGNDEEVKDEISFPKLNRLELHGLSKLESFCSSGNHAFGFPSLATLILDKCPKMKMFCPGNLNAPLLNEVRHSEWSHNDDQWIWGGSLNRTIKLLFYEKNLEEELWNFLEDEANSSTCRAQVSQISFSINLPILINDHYMYYM